MAKVSVTELAQLGKCERQVYYDHIYGAEHEKVRAAAEQGREAHLVFAERLSGKTDRRCFVASCVFGADAWQTEALRDWRDECLLSAPGGRTLVRLYYALSPQLVPYLEKSAWLRRSTAKILESWLRGWKKIDS